jgi:hypothetical protein
MKKVAILLVGVLIAACNTYDAKKELTGVEYNKFLTRIAPYVIKKPDEFSYEERFDSGNQSYYQEFINETEGELTYFFKSDTVSFFFFSHRDHTSLYEHYRGLGGYTKLDKEGKIIFLNLLYHTPRFTKEEMEEKGRVLFKEMVTQGNVKKYVGDRNFIHTPNNDFYYNTKTNRWDYTPNSSWKFLEEARDAASVEDSVTTK